MKSSLSKENKHFVEYLFKFMSRFAEMADLKNYSFCSILADCKKALPFHVYLFPRHLY